MAVHQEILNTLRDPNRIFRPYPVLTPAQLHVLDRTWEWEWDDETTGLPHFNPRNPNHDWERRLPSRMLVSEFAQTDVGQRFVTMMQNNSHNFFVPCTRNRKRSLLEAILQADIKKITVTDVRGGVRLEKTNMDLLDFDHPPMQPLIYPLQSLETRASGRSKMINELMTEINLNGARGFYGGGSHQCRDSRCIITGPLLTQSREVRWGPGPNQVTHIVKRFRCDAKNVIYLLHCDACLQMGLWTSYVGETHLSVGLRQQQNLHQRVSQHTRILSSGQVRMNYQCNPDELCAIAYERHVLGEPDPDQLLRDPFSHFTIVHSPSDRRYTILDGNYATKGERRFHERMLMYEFGNFVYDPVTRSGALNHRF